jgi:hypothetical protein
MSLLVLRATIVSKSVLQRMPLVNVLLFSTIDVELESVAQVT